MFGGSEAAGEAGFLGGRGDRIRLACGGRHEQKKNRGEKKGKKREGSELQGGVFLSSERDLGGGLLITVRDLRAEEEVFQVWLLCFSPYLFYFFYFSILFFISPTFRSL